MNKQTFRTNINCSGCVAAVTPHLSGNKDIESWSVDTADPKKVLTINTRLTIDQIKEILASAGYKAEFLT